MRIKIAQKGRQTWNLEVDPSDHVLKLRQRIENATKIPLDEIKVFWNGIDMEEQAFKYLAPRPLTDFGITEDSVVELQGGVKIFCKPPNGRLHQIIVSVFSTETIRFLKQVIHEKEPDLTPPPHDMLLTQDNVVLDDDKKLSYYGFGTNWWFTCVTV
jgi:hypothetical protein